MAFVPAGFIVALDGSGAVPSGWERATELDGYHPKGAAAGADPGTAGGSDTHTHSSPGHTHTVGSHSHTGGTSGTSPASVFIGAVGDASKSDIADTTHNHTNPNSGAQTSTLSATVATFGTANNDPPFYTVRWIRSLGTASGIPSGAWAYWDAAVLPSGYSSPAAVRLKYLKGASTGANGGGTGGSSSGHTHSGVAHTHGIASHSHTGGTTGGAGQDDDTEAGSTSMATLAHTHAATYGASGSTSGSTAAGPTGSSTNEPAYVKLGIVQNDTGDVDLTVGLIGLWLGLLSSLPGSLAVCDGTGGTIDTRGKYVKGADLSGADFTGIGGTGGGAAHDHTDPSAHTHDASHTHAVTYGASSASTNGTGGALQLGQYPSHGHADGTSGSGGGTSGNGTQTVDAANNEPQYREVVFVKFTGTIDVTVTAPTDGQEITAPSLTVEWSLSAGTQTSKRIRIYAADQSSVVYDSGVIADATESYDVPVAAGLRTGNTYYIRVTVVNNSGVPGDSDLVEITTAWTAPDVISGVTLTPIGGV